MQPFGKAASFHGAASKFIDDHDLAVFHHVMRVALEQLVRPQSLVHMMQQPYIFDVIERAVSHHAFGAQQLLGMLDPSLGERHGAAFLIKVEIIIDQQRDNLVGHLILVRLGFGLTGNDQRRPCFIDQDRVNFVNNCKMVPALDHVFDTELQIITQIIKAEFIVGAVGHVCLIGKTAAFIRQIAGDTADGHPQPFIDAPHPCRIARCQIVIDGNDMHALAIQGIQKYRKGGNKGFALTGLHFRYLAAMKRNTAHQLDIIMSLAEGALRRLTHTRKGLRQQIVKRCTLGDLAAKINE